MKETASLIKATILTIFLFRLYLQRIVCNYAKKYIQWRYPVYIHTKKLNIVALITIRCKNIAYNLMQCTLIIDTFVYINLYPCIHRLTFV